MKVTTLLSTSALLLGATQAHIAMQSPTPLDPKPDTSPLSSGGENFPCKKPSYGAALQVKAVANATVGQPIQLSFSGSADHMGGSCQVVLSKDGVSALSPSSQFKVIYSIMGGCPGNSGAENTYSVPIPTEVPSGSYTMAWTWFNKVGNREMYMNCAAMTISGGSASDKDFSSLPDMAVYNIKSQNDCKTTEGGDVQFPNPGKYVLTGPGFKPLPPTGGCATGNPSNPLAPGTSTGGGSVALGNGSSASGNNGSSGSSGSGTGTFDDGMYHPNGNNGKQGNNSPSPTAAASKPAASLKAAPTTMAPLGTAAPSRGYIGKNPIPPAAPSGAVGGQGQGLQACATDGAVVCSSDGTMFGLCNWGKVRFMAVAEGTKCVDGMVKGRRVRVVRKF
jgi:hypothetical protein